MYLQTLIENCHSENYFANSHFHAICHLTFQDFQDSFLNLNFLSRFQREQRLEPMVIQNHLVVNLQNKKLN